LSWSSRSAVTVTRTSSLEAKNIQSASLLLAVHQLLGTTPKIFALANILRNISQFVVQVELKHQSDYSAMSPVGQSLSSK